MILLLLILGLFQLSSGGIPRCFLNKFAASRYAIRRLTMRRFQFSDGINLPPSLPILMSSLMICLRMKWLTDTCWYAPIRCHDVLYVPMMSDLKFSRALMPYRDFGRRKHFLFCPRFCLTGVEIFCLCGASSSFFAPRQA